MVSFLQGHVTRSEAKVCDFNIAWLKIWHRFCLERLGSQDLKTAPVAKSRNGALDGVDGVDPSPKLRYKGVHGSDRNHLYSKLVRFISPYLRISNLLVKGGLIIHLLRTMPLKIDDLEDDAFLLAWHLFRVLCLLQEGITMEFVGWVRRFVGVEMIPPLERNPGHKKDIWMQNKTYVGKRHDQVHWIHSI